MSELQQSDLILAGSFVDGELTAEQRVAVENRLQTDPVFAAAVERLQTQRSLMKRLPKFQPTEELADQTLQASLDQVQAILGKWPFESESDSESSSEFEATEKVSLPSDGQDAFNWKSFIAIATTLAGVLFLSVMLWPGDGGTQSNSNVAMTDAETLNLPSTESMQNKAFASPDANANLPGVDSPNVASPADSFAMEAAAAESDIPLPEIVSFSGTPVKSVPVEQVWYVKQSTSVPDVAAINRILVSNAIDVQAGANSLARSKKQTAVPGRQADSGSNSAADVEAFYVAATPSQMKLALAEISNESDISMFEVPQDGLQVAAAKQQFGPAASRSASDTPKTGLEREPASADQALADIATAADQADRLNDATDPSLPRRIELPPNGNALAQQLVSQSLPRNLARDLPRRPVPPILESGMELAELKAIQDRAAVTAGAGMESPGMGSPGMGSNLARTPAAVEGERESAKTRSAKIAAAAPSRPALSRAPAESLPQSSEAIVDQSDESDRANQARYFDRHFDDSDTQLRQYLILVRGSEKQEAEAASESESKARDR